MSDISLSPIEDKSYDKDFSEEEEWFALQRLKRQKTKETVSWGNLADTLGASNSELNELETNPIDTSKAEEQNREEIEIAAAAKRIYESGDALKYMIDYCSRQHLGDQHILSACILSFAGTKILNNELAVNLHIGGSAGSGKSHAMNTVLKILPRDKVFNGRMSDRALLYAAGEITAGTVIATDDQSLSEVSNEIFKAASSDPNQPLKYYVVVDKKLETFQLPPRCPRWLVKADNLGGDEQTNDRLLSVFADDSIEHQARVKKMKDLQAASMTKFDGSKEECICRKIWDFVDSASVLIPFSQRIEVGEGERLRNYALFLALIRSSAVLAGSSKREERFSDAGDRFLVATTEDFAVAAQLMNSVLSGAKGSQREHLTQSESKLLNYLKTLPSGEYSQKEILEETKMPVTSFRHALEGRDGCSGLLRIPGISKVYREGAARSVYVDWDANLYFNSKTARQFFILKSVGEDDNTQSSPKRVSRVFGFEGSENPSESSPIGNSSNNTGISDEGAKWVSMGAMGLELKQKKLFNVRGANYD